MRIWSIHPRHLDRKGLGGAWREAHQAQSIIRRHTVGGEPYSSIPYGNHPQLGRFKAASDPLGAIGVFLVDLRDEGTRRGYNYKAKIDRVDGDFRTTITEGQLAYERMHLLRKLRDRDPSLADALPDLVDVGSMIDVVPGDVCGWERNVDPADRAKAIVMAVQWGMPSLEDVRADMARGEWIEDEEVAA